MVHAWLKALGNGALRQPSQLNASRKLTGADGLAMLLRTPQSIAFLCSQSGDSKHSSDEHSIYMRLSIHVCFRCQHLQLEYSQILPLTVTQCLMRSLHCTADDIVAWQNACTTYTSISKKQPTKPRQAQTISSPCNLLGIHFSVQSFPVHTFSLLYSGRKRANHIVDSALPKVPQSAG